MPSNTAENLDGQTTLSGESPNVHINVEGVDHQLAVIREQRERAPNEGVVLQLISAEKQLESLKAQLSGDEDLAIKLLDEAEEYLRRAEVAQGYEVIGEIQTDGEETSAVITPGDNRVITREEPLPPIVSKQETFDNTDNKFTRRAAEVTFSLINRFDELKPQEGESSDEAFIRVTKALLAERLVVHGRTDPKTGRLIEQSDTDGSVAMELFKRAGVPVSQIKFVEQGQSEQGKLNVDTGNMHGITFGEKAEGSLFSDTAYLDHHGRETGTDLSATELTYQYLIAIGMLERSEELDRLVVFVTDTDNMSGPYQDQRNFGVSHRSVLGLHSRVTARKLIQFFLDGGNPVEEMTDEKIKAIGGERLAEFSRKMGDTHMKSEERLRECQQKGFVVDTPYGQMVIDIEGKIDDMAFAASPYSIHLKWRPGGRQFFRISGMPRELSLGEGQGRGIRIRNLWLKPIDDKGNLTITVSEILSLFGFNPEQATGDLKKFLEGGEVVKGKKSGSGRGKRKEGGHLRWHGSDDDRGPSHGSYDTSSENIDKKKKKKKAA